jgi:hypothetical protein
MFLSILATVRGDFEQEMVEQIRQLPADEQQKVLRSLGAE